MVRDIYPEGSQVLAQLFASGKPFLVVPLDLAKKEHTAQCCTKEGRYEWKRPLRIWNNIRGVDYLLQRVEGVGRKLSISPDRVVYAGEDPASYALAFIEELKRRGGAFVRVRATKAAELRSSSRASSDNKDLDGIAHAVLNRFASDMEETSGVYAQLRLASRARHKAARLEISLTNRIHQTMDRLFPGFLNEGKSGIRPFGPACLSLLKECITPKRVLAMSPERLTGWLKKHGVIHAEKTGETLRALAADTPQAEPGIVASMSGGLKSKVALLEAIRVDIASEENEMARNLVQTPAAVLTSIPGMGVALVGGIVGELGDPRHWRGLNRMYSYAGCAQRQKQSGGPDKLPVGMGLPHDCNHRLKNWLLQAAFHVGTTQHPARRIPGLDGKHRLLNDWQVLAARDGHTRLGIAKRLLRIMDAMITEQRIYLPQWWLDTNQTERPEPGLDATWLETATVAMEEKWKQYDLTGIPDELNHLKIWRKNANELIKTLNVPF